LGQRQQPVPRLPLPHHRVLVHQYFWKHIAFHPHIPGMRPLTLHIMVMHAIYSGVALWLSVIGYWREVLMLWIFPHFLASALIIYFFAYLTHAPHEVHERYRDTNVFWVKGKIMEPVVNWLYMFQNFHLIHHLFPRVPFYLYPKAFRSLKPVLEREKAISTSLGRNLQPVESSRRKSGCSSPQVLLLIWLAGTTPPLSFFARR
jgi:beta-carotene hydroxylase